MTRSERAPAADGYDHREPAFDPGLLDDLRCRAEGIQAQATYNASKAEELETARKDFDTACGAYVTARAAAEPLVKQARSRLEELADRITCQLDAADTERLDRAYRRVVDRLRRCGDTAGCCHDGDCDYDDEVRDCEPEDVAATIADIAQRTADAQACFAELVREPSEALPGRVADVQKEVEDLATGMTDGSWSQEKQYAAVLVGRRHLRAVWRGFTNTPDYTDCLGGALTCMIKGHSAIAELTRKQTVHECHQRAWRSACDRLKSDTLTEVLTEYERICGDDADRPDDDYEVPEGREPYDGRPEPPEQYEDPDAEDYPPADEESEGHGRQGRTGSKRGRRRPSDRTGPDDDQPATEGDEEFLPPRGAEDDTSDRGARPTRPGRRPTNSGQPRDEREYEPRPEYQPRPDYEPRDEREYEQERDGDTTDQGRAARRPSRGRSSSRDERGRYRAP